MTMTTCPYDAVAEEYAREVAPRYAPIADLVVSRALRGPAPSSVVELAAGTGNLTGRLAPRLPGCRYVALDVSGAMLDVAARHVGPAVELLVATLESVPLPDAVADLVVSALSPVQDSDAGLAEVVRLLRPGGRLVVAMWGPDYAELRLLDAARRRVRLDPYPTRDLRATALRVERAGLVDVVQTEHRMAVAHASVPDYLRYRAAFGVPPGMTPEQLGRYDAAVATEAWRRTGADGAVVLDWSVVVLEARRP
jgi:SAM-dependent methyltransferase